MKQVKQNSKVINIGVKHAGLASSVFFGKFISLIMGGLMLVVVARVIGPSQYGIYTIALAVASSISAFGAINIGAYFNKIIPSMMAEKQVDLICVLLGDGILLILFISIVLTLIGFVLSAFIAHGVFGSTAHITELYIALLGIVGIIFYPIANTIIVSVGNRFEIMIASMSGITFMAAISLILVLLGWGAIGALIGYVLGYFLASVVVFYFIHRRIKLVLKVKGIRARLGKMLSFSLPLTVAGFVSTLMASLPAVILGILLIPTGLIGQFGVASKIGQIFDLAAGSISATLIPMFSTAIYSHVKSKVNALYHNTIYYTVLFTAPIIIYASVLSGDIILTVFTSAYTAAIVYMPLISIGFLLNLLWTAALYLLASYGKVSKVMKYTAISGIVQIISAVVLGSLFHVIGIIAAFFYIGNIVYIALFWKELRRMGVRVRYSMVARVLLACLILAVALSPLLLLQIRPLYILVIGIVEMLFVYPIALGKTGAVSKEQIFVLSKVGDEMPLIGSGLDALISYTNLFISD